MGLINHIKRWNKWRKRCLNSWPYKLLVLFGWYSPTFELTFTDEEEASLYEAFMKGMEEGMKQNDTRERS